MTPRHHPGTGLLAEFAGANLHSEQHVVIAAHLRQCVECRAHVAALEAAAGAALETLPPTGLAADAFARVTARLHADAANVATAAGAFDLAHFTEALPAGPWMRITSRLEARRLDLGLGGKLSDGHRLILLRGRAGAKLARHTHTGREMTCVLSGSFFENGERYTAGDFTLATSDIAHEIVIGDDGPCVSLVALEGRIKLHGLRGRLLQPFFRL